MSKATGVSQQDLFRQAIRNLLPADNFGGLQPKPTKPVHQVAPGISIVRTEPQPKAQAQPKTDSRPPQPSPDHTWVVRGTGGYWRSQERTGPQPVYLQSGSMPRRHSHMINVYITEIMEAGGGMIRRALRPGDRATSAVRARLLRQHGHTALTAGSLAAALEVAGAEDLDRLISDLGRPDGSGLELMRRRARGVPSRGSRRVGSGETRTSGGAGRRASPAF